MMAAALIQFILSNWRALALGLVVAGAYITGHHMGHNDGVESTEAKYLAEIAERDRAANDAMARAITEAQAQADAALATERQHMAEVQKTDTQFQIIEKTVTKYVERHPDSNRCTIDVDGLRAWNSANRGSATHSHRYP